MEKCFEHQLLPSVKIGKGSNLVGAYQVEMEDRKTTDKPHTNEAVDDQNHGGWCLQHCLPNR
jgi:hypothetical protein